MTSKKKPAPKLAAKPAPLVKAAPPAPLVKAPPPAPLVKAPPPANPPEVLGTTPKAATVPNSEGGGGLPATAKCPKCGASARLSGIPGDEASITIHCSAPGCGSRNIGRDWKKFAIALLLLPLLCLSACAQMRQFGRGFADASVDEVVRELDARFGERLSDERKEILTEIPKLVPSPERGTWAYSLGALVAALVANGAQSVIGKRRNGNGNFNPNDSTRPPNV